MPRSSAIALVGLLFLATGLGTAALFTQSLSARHLGMGLLLGQIVLAAAVVVLACGMLPLRLLFLGLVLFYSTTLLCLTSFLSPLQVALQLVGAALVSVAWCAALRFFGWRIVGIPLDPSRDGEEDDTQRAGQFSLATVMWITMIVAVYLGLLRASDLTWSNGLPFLLICVLLMLPACLLLHVTAQVRWAWLLSVIVVPILSLCLASLIGYGILDGKIALVARALASELTFLGVALLVLRFAGMRLGMPQKPARENHRSGVSIAGSTIPAGFSDV